MGWLDKFRVADHNVVGQAYAWTMFSAITPGQEDALERYLEGVPMGPDSPWASMAGIHFMRLYVVRQFVHQGPSQQPDPLRNAYLVTDATFDGDLPGFIRALCRTLPDEADTVYGHCVGYPGSGDPDRLLAWARHNAIDSGVVLGAYPDASAPQVIEALALREKVGDFAGQAHRMDAESLQKAFRDRFGLDPASA